MTRSSAALAQAAALTDDDIVGRVRAGQVELFELLMRRHNQRLYRAVRSIVRDDADAEDVMQQAYISAYTHLEQFAADAKFSTWLVRIAINEALGKLRKGRRLVAIDTETEELEMPHPTPEDNASRRQLLGLLERAV